MWVCAYVHDVSSCPVFPGIVSCDTFQSYNDAFRVFFCTILHFGGCKTSMIPRDHIVFTANNIGDGLIMKKHWIRFGYLWRCSLKASGWTIKQTAFIFPFSIFFSSTWFQRKEKTLLQDVSCIFGESAQNTATINSCSFFYPDPLTSFIQHTASFLFSSLQQCIKASPEPTTWLWGIFRIFFRISNHTCCFV